MFEVQPDEEQLLGSLFGIAAFDEMATKAYEESAKLPKSDLTSRLEKAAMILARTTLIKAKIEEYSDLKFGKKAIDAVGDYINRK